MSYNLTWDQPDEKSLILSLAGHGFGDTLEEAWPKLYQKKAYDAAFIARNLDLVSTDIMAEIGTGVGIVADILAPQVAHYHCIDISQSFLDVCRKTSGHNPNISYHLMPVGNLSALEGKGVTKILADGVFIHFNLFDLYIYLTQIYRMLPKDGRLMFQVINAEFDGLLADPTWQEQVEIYRGDKTRVFGLMSWISPMTVQKMLKGIGFLVADILWPEEQYVHFVAMKR